MKNILGVGLFAVLVTAFFWAFQVTDASYEGASRIPSSEGGYCIALRGNGEAEPAHWGALARTVEQLGLPDAMAGGSSASISLFLLEAVASNPFVQGQPAEIQKERASLLLKSMMGFFGELQKTQTWNDIKKFYGMVQNPQDESVLKKVLQSLEAQDMGRAEGLLKRALDLGLLNPASLQPLWKAIKSADIQRARFYTSELIETARVFGQFNAATDDNLFFRAGIVNFDKAGETFGKIAGFYALAGDWKNFLEACASDSIGRSWPEIVTQNPNCAGLFHAVFEKHFAQPEKAPHIEDRMIGRTIRVYPTTSVLTDSAAKDSPYKEFRRYVVQYHRQMDPHFGKDFRLSRPEDIRYGYWGNRQDLESMRGRMDPQDEKSRRFLALGDTNWRQVLALSPAEPGLSPLKEFTNDRGEHFISAGGWSDLHPVAVLKAAGCDKVVYLTRTGGDSIFGQGVAKRLLGLERGWDKLNSASAEVKKLNNEGDPSDQTSLWSRLFNLANPQSSYNRALAKADAVLCTNWDAYAVQSQFVELIEDSYRSSFWVSPSAGAAISALQPRFSERRSGCVGYGL